MKRILDDPNTFFILCYPILSPLWCVETSILHLGKHGMYTELSIVSFEGRFQLCVLFSRDTYIRNETGRKFEKGKIGK